MRIARTMTAVLSLIVLSGTAGAADKKITYEEHVKPIFRQKCFSCHNTDKKTADLDLTNYTAMMAGGGSGEAVSPGSPDDSYLFMLVNHDSEPYMPPKSDKMPEPMIATIRAWIEGGALENSASKAMKKKPAADFALKGAPIGKPDGPPPMPDVLNLEPYVTPKSKTAVTAIATSPWAPLVAVAGQKQVTLYHSKTLQPLGVLPFPEGIPHVLKFSRNGMLLLAGGGHGSLQGRVVVWDIKTGQRIFEVGDELDAVLAADISADQSMIALGGPQRVVRVYSTSDGELVYEIRKHTDWIYSLEFSPDGVLLATADRTGGLHVWEAETGRQYLTLNGHKKSVTGVTWRSDANVLASCSEDQAIKLWEMENGKQIKTWNAHGPGTASVEFCRDGRLVSCGRDKVTKLWDQNGKQLRAFEKFGDLALRVTHCDEANCVISGDWTGEIRVWNAVDGKRLGVLNQSPPKLADRLSTVNTELVAARTQSGAAVAASKVAQDKLNTINAALTKAKTDSATMEKQHNGLVAEKNTLAKAAPKLNADVESLTVTEAKLKKSVPLLQQALSQATQAAKTLKDDKELAATVAVLKKKSAQRQAELVNTSKALVARKAEQTKSAARMKTIAVTLKTVIPQLASAKKQITQLTPQVKPAQDGLNKANATAQAANSRLQVAQRQLQLWTEYKSLHGEMKVLSEKEQAFQDKAALVAEAKDVIDQAMSVVKTSEDKMKAEQQAMQAMIAKMQATQKSITDMTAQQAAEKARLEKTQAAVPVLQATLVQAQTAVKTIGDDKEVAALATQIQQVIGTKNQSIVAMKKSMADKATAIAAANKQVVEINKQQLVLKAALAAAQKAVEKAMADMAPLRDKLASVEQAANQARAALEEAKKTVEKRKQRIRPVLNLTQAS